MSEEQEETLQQLELLKIYRRRLLNLTKQFAIYGAGQVPTHIIHDIQECKDAIENLKSSLAERGISIENALYDQEETIAALLETSISVSNFIDSADVIYDDFMKAWDVRTQQILTHYQQELDISKWPMIRKGEAQAIALKINELSASFAEAIYAGTANERFICINNINLLVIKNGFQAFSKVQKKELDLHLSSKIQLKELQHSYNKFGLLRRIGSGAAAGASFGLMAGGINALPGALIGASLGFILQDRGEVRGMLRSTQKYLAAKLMHSQRYLQVKRFTIIDILLSRYFPKSK